MALWFLAFSLFSLSSSVVFASSSSRSSSRRDSACSLAAFAASAFLRRASRSPVATSISAFLASIFAFHGWSSFCLTSIWSWKTCVLSRCAWLQLIIAGQSTPSLTLQAIANLLQGLLGLCKLLFEILELFLLLLHLRVAVFNSSTCLVLSMLVLHSQLLSVFCCAKVSREITYVGDRFLQLLSLGVRVLALLLQADLFLLSSGEILNRSCSSLLYLLQ